MAWVGGIPRNPALNSKRADELALIGDDLIHESLGCPKGRSGTGRGMAGLGDEDVARNDRRFQNRFYPLDHPDFREPAADRIDTTDLAMAEIIDIVYASELTEREVSVLVRYNSGGESRNNIAHDLELPIVVIDSAYARGMAAIAISAARTPYFGLRDAYREDLRRTRHRRTSKNRRHKGSAR